MTRRHRFILLIGFTLAFSNAVFAQATLTPPQEDAATGRIFTLYGDLTLFLGDDVPATTMFDLILYSRENEAVARQRVGKGGRYSFNNVVEGNYFIGVELENVEIANELVGDELDGDSAVGIALDNFGKQTVGIAQQTRLLP